MSSMGIHEPHRYTFEVAGWGRSPELGETRTFRASTVAPSLAVAERRCRAMYRKARSVMLVNVSPGPKPCTDARCAVCWPSSSSRAA